VRCRRLDEKIWKSGGLECWSAEGDVPCATLYSGGYGG